MALSLVSFLLANQNDAIPYSAASFQGRNGETNCHRLSQYSAKNRLFCLNIFEAFLN